MYDPDGKRYKNSSINITKNPVIQGILDLASLGYGDKTINELVETVRKAAINIDEDAYRKMFDHSTFYGGDEGKKYAGFWELDKRTRELWSQHAYPDNSITFTMIDRKTPTDALSADADRILILFAKNMYKNGCISVANEVIANKLDIGIKRVRSAIKELVEYNYIEIVQEVRGHKARVYRVNNNVAWIGSRSKRATSITIPDDARECNTITKITKDPTLQYSEIIYAPPDSKTVKHKKTSQNADSADTENDI